MATCMRILCYDLALHHFNIPKIFALMPLAIVAVVIVATVITVKQQ